MSNFLLRLLNFLSRGLLWIGSAAIIMGALSPWASVTLLKNIHVTVPGMFFAEGGLCLAAGSVVFIGMRRLPLFCLIASLFILHWVAAGAVSVPERVKHQIIGTQLAMMPINRLLTQFRVNEIDIADWTIPNNQLLADGITWTQYGAYALLLGAALGVPGDPIIVWIYRKAARRRCRNCDASWPIDRDVAYCPQCGLSTMPADPNHCRSCGEALGRKDKFCTHCGTDRNSEFPNSPQLQN